MQNIAAGRTMAEWIAFASEVGVAISPYVPIEDLPTNEHARARGMLVAVPGPNTGQETLLTGSAVKYGSADVTFTPAPEFGAESLAVLHDYGMEADRVQKLLSTGVVQVGSARE